MTDIQYLRSCLCGWLLGGWLLATSAFAAGQPLEAELERRLTQQPLAAVYTWLIAQPLAQVPTERAQQLRWAGQMALQLQRPGEAITHFERLLLLEPFDLGTRLDLTLAYLAQDNQQAATASLKALHRYRGEAPLPLAAERVIQRLEQQLQPDRRAGAALVLEGSLAVVQGYDSNVNLGPHNPSLDLILWGQLPVQAQLSADSLAQASAYTEVAARVAASRDDSSTWQLGAAGSARRYHDLERLHQHEALLNLRWQPGESLPVFNLQSLYQHIDDVGTQLTLDADGRLSLGDRWLLVGGLQWQDPPQGLPTHRLQLGLWRQWHGWLTWGRSSYQWRPERSAGDTWRWELGLAAPAWRWGSTTLQAFVQWEQRQDARAYSPAFFGEARRNEQLTTLGLLGRYPLGDSLELQLDARWEQSHADLALFEYRRWQLEGRLRWRW